MKYSIITTCKNRLSHLKQSLPTFVLQQDAEVIVVDYDCPEKTRDYVRENFPAVKVVAIDNEPKFSATIARNFGAAVADGEILIFMDADICLTPNFIETLELDANEFGIFVFANDVRGSCIVPKSVFNDVGGYDEVMFGYSQEDLELYARLSMVGYKAKVLPKELIDKIVKHSDSERVAFYDMGRKLAYVRGKLYRDAKNHLLLLSRRKELTLEVRQSIWQKINEMLMAPNLFDGVHCLEIPIPVSDSSEYLPNCTFTASIRLNIELKP